MRVLEASFLTSAADPSGWPSGDLPEVAVVGRSNVGKSSLVNALAGRRRLARVSATPGRTRLLNFYLLRTDVGDLTLVDLPGFGYARVARTERVAWRRMVEGYLSRRAAIRLVVLLVDIRRGPKEEELELARWLRERQVPTLVVLTKADKLPRTRHGAAVEAAARALGCPPSEVVLFSSETGRGRDELLERIGRVL